MRRLRSDTSSTDPVSLEAVRLLQVTHPLLPSQALRQRVRAALSAKPRTTRFRVPLRMAIGAAAIMGFMAMASAMVAHLRRSDHPSASAEGIRASMPVRSRPQAAAPRSVLPAVALEPPLSAASERPIPKHRPLAVDSALPDAPSAVASSATAPERAEADVRARAERRASILLQSGIRALRQRHDCEDAGLQFAEYLRGSPKGAFAEEVLALSIEAAATCHGSALRSLATEYLDRYQSGRFSSMAERALP